MVALVPSGHLPLCPTRRGLGTPASLPPPERAPGPHRELLRPQTGSGGSLGPAGPSPSVSANKQVPSLVTPYRYTGTGGRVNPHGALRPRSSGTGRSASGAESRG